MPLPKESLQQLMTVNPPPPEINAVYFKEHLTDTVFMKEICPTAKDRWLQLD